MTRKAGKTGKKKCKKPAAGGSKAKNMLKGSKRKSGGGKAKAKEDSSSTKEKEDSSKKKNKDEPFKSLAFESFATYLPSYPGWCGCGASKDCTDSSIPWSTD